MKRSKSLKVSDWPVKFREINGKKAVQVGVTAKEQKKLRQEFPGFDLRFFQCLRAPGTGGESFDEYDRVDEEPGCDERRHLETVQPSLPARSFCKRPFDDGRRTSRGWAYPRGNRKKRPFSMPCRRGAVRGSSIRDTNSGTLFFRRRIRWTSGWPSAGKRHCP